MFKFIVPICIAVLLLVPLQPAHASLVVCGRTAPDAPASEKQDCTPCMLLVQIKAVIDFITLELVPIVAFLLIVIAGFMIVIGGASPETIGTGKKMLTNTVIGVVIIYLSWLAANTVIKAVAGDNDVAASWFELKCKEPTGTGSTSGTSGGTSGGGPLPVSGTKLTDAQARAALVPGVTVKPGASLDQINQSTIDEVNRLQQQCQCNVVITEGTGGTHEPGLYSHANGYKVDLRSKTDAGTSNTLTNYIFSNPGTYTYTRTRTDGTKVYTEQGTGVEYAYEQNPPHWDVLVK